MTLPPEVLAKLRKGVSLTGPEQDMVARCPEIGSRLLGRIPRLESVAQIVLFHGKNFDGTGFPIDAVAGESIPVGSRILRVLRELAHLEAKGIVRFKALERMREVPSHFDPAVLAAVRKAFDLAGEGSIDDSVQITLKKRQIGHMLRDAVRTLDDMLILNKGSVITPLILERVRNFADLSGVKEPILVAKELDLPKD